MTGTTFLVSEASENRVNSALKNIKQVMHEYWVVHSKAILPSRCRAFLAGYERKMESLRIITVPEIRLLSSTESQQKPDLYSPNPSSCGGLNFFGG